MDGSIAGKVAVVTGGASGIGRGIAEALLEAGARVVVADIEVDPLDRTARDLGVTGLQVDVADSGSVRALAAEVERRFGTANILVNNAGVGAAGPIDGLTLEDWKWMLGVNLSSVIHGLVAFLPLLKRDPAGGHVVNTASMSGVAPLPLLGSYAVAKSGVVALTEVFAAEQRQHSSKIGASVLLAGPTRSNIGNSSRNRPANGGASGLGDFQSTENPDNSPIWRMPIEIGRKTVAAIRNDELYVFTHPEQFHRIEERHAAMHAAAARARGQPS